MAMATAKRAPDVDVVIYGQTQRARAAAGRHVGARRRGQGGAARSARSATPPTATPPSPGGSTRSATSGSVIFTDDQQHDSGHVRLDHVPLIYTFNLAGYRPSALPAGERGRYTLGGFTDATFTVMKVLEDGRNADWPF